MAEIEIGPLADRLADDEISDLKKALEKVGAPQVPSNDDGVSAKIADGVDDDVLAEFLDRLEAYDIACEIYLPTEFEGRVDLGDRRVGSAAVLLEVLEELKDELAVEDDEDEDAEDDEDEEDEDEDEDEDDEDDYAEMKLIEAQLRQLWKLFHSGAEAAIDRKLPLYVG